MEFYNWTVYIVEEKVKVGDNGLEDMEIKVLLLVRDEDIPVVMYPVDIVKSIRSSF